MVLNFIPSGHVGLEKLIEQFVQKLYGPAAVASPEVHDAKGQLEVTRAGEKISYGEDIARWETAREGIRQDLAAGAVPALVKTVNMDEFPIPQDYWDTEIAWHTMMTGLLEYENEPEMHRRAVYLREADCAKILKISQPRPRKKTREGAARQMAQHGEKGSSQNAGDHGGHKRVGDCAQSSKSRNERRIPYSLFRNGSPFPIASEAGMVAAPKMSV